MVKNTFPDHADQTSGLGFQQIFKKDIQSCTNMRQVGTQTVHLTETVEGGFYVQEEWLTFKGSHQSGRKKKTSAIRKLQERWKNALRTLYNANRFISMSVILKVRI